MSPREFCGHQRRLIQGMAMRKKRNVRMGPIQQLKLRLLDHVDAANPPVGHFEATLAEGVITVADGGATGPAQAVASDLVMDWKMACSSPDFCTWLRQTSQEQEPLPSASS